jgi:hypothetical protein
MLRSYETPSPQDPAVALNLGSYDDPRGVGVSYERGTPVESYLDLAAAPALLRRSVATRML